jgi:superfamily II DNA/RNA helicase
LAKIIDVTLPSYDGIGVVSSRDLSLPALTSSVVHRAENDTHKQTLCDLLISILPSRNMVFVKPRKTAKVANDFLVYLCLPATSIYADRTQ